MSLKWSTTVLKKPHFFFQDDQYNQMVKSSQGTSEQDGSVMKRRALTWTRDEVLRLLRAWWDVLLQEQLLSSPSSDSPRASSSQEGRERGDFNTRAFERFVELSHGAVHVPERHEESAATKRRTLLRTFRHAVEYNEQQEEEHSRFGKRKKRAKKQQNHWLALTAEQRQSLTEQFPRNSFAEIDEEMFKILSVIDKAETKRKERVLARRGRNVPWTKGEVWVLINAWRRVIESQPKTRDLNSSINVMVNEQFVALSQEGMPRRTKPSVRNKLAKLIRLYRLISEFNKAGGSSSNGPHEVDASDWFSSSLEVQAEYIASRYDRSYKFAELDQDTFNAMEMIIENEESLQNDASMRNRDGHPSHGVIDISSDTECEHESDASDWEMLPVTPSGTWRSQGTTGNTADGNGWKKSHYSNEPEGRAQATGSQRHQVEVTTEPSTRHLQLHDTARMVASSESEDNSSRRARKRAKVNLEQLSASQTESFLELLAKLKKERKADKLKRRKERAERKEFVELITQERDERLRDREERQKERQKWELERDKLKFKLRKIREQYKKAAAKLKSLQ